MNKKLLIAILVLSVSFMGAKCQKEKKFDISQIPVEKIQVGDIEIAYKTFGEGKPMILIMGLGGTMDMWNVKLLENLSKNYKIYIFDNRGMGLTTSTGKNYAITDMADDSVGFMNKLNIDKAIVLGWSLGTYVAQEMTLNYPEKVEKLILYAADCGTPGTAILPTPEVIEELKGSHTSSQNQIDTMMKLLFPQDWLTSHPQPDQYFPKITETTSAQNLALQNNAWDEWEGVCDRIGNIKTPTLLVSGTDDVLTPPANSSYLVEHISDSWLVKFPDAGHGLMYQYPENLANVINNFVINSR